jgi:PAS domain S-box-containing protein
MPYADDSSGGQPTGGGDRRRDPPSYDTERGDYAGISSGALDPIADLRDARAFAEVIVDTVREGLLVLDLDLRVVTANESFYQTFEVRPEETVGRLVFDLGNGQWDIPELRELLEDVLPENHAFDGLEVDHAFEGLGRRVMVLNGRRLNDHALVLLAIDDVTALRTTERELTESEERFELFAENAREYAVIGMDAEARITTWGASAERVMGWTRAEALGRPGHIIFTEEDRAAGAPERELATARAEGAALDERWHVRRDGTRFWGAGVLVALQDGDLRGYAKVLRDDAQRREAEDALRESEAKYRALFESVSQGFCLLEVLFDGDVPVDYRFLEANPAFERHTGLVGAVGRTVRELVPDLEGHWVETYGRVARTGEPARFEEGSDAMGRWFEVEAFRVGAPEAHHVAVLFTDATDRRRAEAERREREERYLALFEQAPGFIAVLRGPNHVFAFANPAYRRLVGDRPLVGRTVREALPEVEGQGFLALLDGVFREGESHAATDQPVLLRRGGEPARRYVDFVYEPFREPDGSVSGVIVLGVDTTDRVVTREELARANRELEGRVEERTGQVRELARALTLAEHEERRRIAHVLHEDLQQTLAGAQIRVALGDADRAEGLLSEAIETTRRLSHELSPPLVRGGSVSELLEWVAARKRKLYGLDVTSEVRGEVTLGREDLRVLLYQLLRELLFNVAKHAGTGRARVTAERAGDRVRVVVADEGAGFDPAALDAARAPAGLGLPSVRERLELVGGRLEVESAPGEGTQVTVELPVETGGGATRAEVGGSRR